MLFKRKLYQKLLKWKEISAGSSALLIEGARRIGKSTIVEELRKQNMMIICYWTLHAKVQT